MSDDDVIRCPHCDWSIANIPTWRTLDKIETHFAYAHQVGRLWEGMQAAVEAAARPTRA